jgi:hypothetical protein
VSLTITEDGVVKWLLEYGGQRVAGGLESAELVVFAILRAWNLHASGLLLPAVRVEVTA